ncbi:homogentisate 1,2-dioxygenase, partial [Vibrio alfacsensis]
FFGPATHFHHQHAPTGWTEWEGELKPRAFNLNNIEGAQQTSPWSIPTVLENNECKIRVWRLQEAMSHLVRNADGDELLFIHQGSADLYCDYGHLEVSDGDYVVIPRSTNWRLEPHSPMF